MIRSTICREHTMLSLQPFEIGTFAPFSNKSTIYFFMIVCSGYKIWAICFTVQYHKTVLLMAVYIYTPYVCSAL